MDRPRMPTGLWTVLGLAVPLVALGSAPARAAAPSCHLGNGIKHVVQIVFDNVHLTRDNPNVPSDLEQMPNLLNFMLDNGTVSGNHFTPLISHTANDIITMLTGVYPDRHGVPVANSYRVFDANGAPSGSHGSFVYWTATDPTDKLPVMVNEKGKTAPAPWVPFARAGCDVGAFSVANMEFETLPGDLGVVYGTSSKEFTDADAALKLQSTPANQPKIQKPKTDWLGIALHCAQGSPLCASGKPDVLPDEPGPEGQPGPNQYVGFNAVYGNINVAPVICPPGETNACSASKNVKDLDGNVIADAYGQPGFPNIFNPTATQSLGYAATMMEAGAQVVYVYVALAHNRNPLPLNPNTNAPTADFAFGPGEAEYVAQLKAYDKAFGQFFARLEAHGINKHNTLFLVTADENDHFVGGTPTPANCDGVHTPCTYVYPNTSVRSVGELTTTLDSLLLTQRGSLAAQFLVHADDAPNIYVSGNPAPTDAATRKLQQDVAALTFTNPLPGNNGRLDTLAPFLADRAEMQLLHMVTFSPARTPTFTVFGNPDYFFVTSVGSLPLAPRVCPPASVPPTTGCVVQGPGFAWNHGDVQQDIVKTWFGLVGPGVRHQGRDDRVFSDHTDLRPTVMALLNLTDDYVHDGRVLAEDLEQRVLPASVGSREGDEGSDFIALAQVYKQLTAPLGELSRASLALATKSIKGTDTDYNWFLSTIGPIIAERDQLAEQIKVALNAAAFGGHGHSMRNAQSDVLIARARRLIDAVEDLAAGSKRW